MASYMDMSLEDIIQKKKKNSNNNRNNSRKLNQFKRQLSNQKPLTVTDARIRIISKKRTKIMDAREKLAELAKRKDARFKLDLLRERKALLGPVQERNVYQNQVHYTKYKPKKEKVFLDPSRQVVSQPLTNSRPSLKHRVSMKNFVDSRTIRRSQATDRQPTIKPILRTVENDIEIIDEPMEMVYNTKKSSPVSHKPALQLKIIAHNNDMRDNRNYVKRTAVAEKEKSPPRLPSILKKRPIAAMSKNDKKKAESSESLSTLEYRIIVSNLRNTVTGGDIEELFGDVGGMLESRLVRPGTAEVLYKSLEDAQKAVELYHNRQLDGQPMNCLLVTPRTTAASQRFGNNPALYSTNSNVEPDISTFHKVLFSNF